MDQTSVMAPCEEETDEPSRRTWVQVGHRHRVTKDTSKPVPHQRPEATLSQDVCCIPQPTLDQCLLLTGPPHQYTCPTLPRCCQAGRGHSQGLLGPAAPTGSGGCRAGAGRCCPPGSRPPGPPGSPGSAERWVAGSHRTPGCPLQGSEGALGPGLPSLHLRSLPTHGGPKTARPRTG